MGLRNADVRKLAVPDMTTTVLTLTVTGLAADSALAGGTSPGWKRRVMDRADQRTNRHREHRHRRVARKWGANAKLPQQVVTVLVVHLWLAERRSPPLPDS